MSRRSARPGRVTPAPSSRTRALVLRQLTGLSPSQVTSRAVCPRPAPGYATCAAQAMVLRSSGALVRPHITRYRTLSSVRPAFARGAQPAATSGNSAPQPGTPAYLEQAYDLSYLSQTGGANDTVAIVDAYDDPNAESDLATYRATYGLPDCTTTNGCFRKVGQDGSSSLPDVNGNWLQEISLDLDAVSAICPNCHILLVEANSSRFSDLEAGMQTAASHPGVGQISASWFGTSNGVPPMFRTFSGVATVAASGDYGYPGPGADNYPAALPGVTAAGGTSLAAAAAVSARGYGETAWSWNGVNGGGSGCDLQFPRPAYQPAEGCAGRAYADLSADADPQTGLAVYSNGNWGVVGGTSLATPLIAAYYAISGVASASPEWAYGQSGALNDVVSGSTGTCDTSNSYICDAGPGYDGPTGMGSISGSVVTGAPGIGGPSFNGTVTGGGSGNTYTQSVAAHGATITAGIYPNGLATTWWLEYGTSDTYGSKTAPINMSAGTGPVSVTASLSQLSPNTAYHYRLVARNSLGTTYGNDNTLMTSAASASAPTASLAVSPLSTTPGTRVSFDGSASQPPSGSGSITDYGWNFGDGVTRDTGTTASTRHTYIARGTYTVTLTVTSSGGQTDSATQTVTVDNPPTAVFQPSHSAVPAGSTVLFDGTGSVPGAGGSITDYSWNFGDGSSADTDGRATESHTFDSPGTYPVTLTTTDDLNVTNTTTPQQVTVANFTADPAVPAPRQPVTLTAGSPDPACGTVTGYTWDLGDSSQPQTTTEPSIVYSYAARGTYNVTLSYQCTGSAVPDEVATLTVDNLTAAFTSRPATFLPGTTVSFDASGSGVDPGTITDYTWSFGDGSQAVDTHTTASTAHTFTTPGSHTVTLTITDELGTVSTISHQVTADRPSAAFTVYSSTGPAPGVPLTFDASAASDPASPIIDYTWDFGNGIPVDAQSSATTPHSFDAAGTYTVELTVTDQLGFTSSASRQVVIAPPVTGTSNPPTTTTSPPTPTPTPPVTTPTPTPPVTKTQAPLSLVARLTGSGRQRLTQVLAHGLRLGLTVNQRTRASFQITVPMWQTKQGGHKGKPVVLLRGAQTLGAGKHTITLKLSRSATRRLATHGSLVLTVRMTLTAANGKTLTRTVKITLTR
jgi:PKD repeat protein